MLSTRYPPNAYNLRIAEEDGSVDWAFMPLPHSERMDRFGFQLLAIAPDTQPHLQSWHQQPVTVTVWVWGGVV